LVDHAAARSTESGKRVHSITRKGDDFQPQSWLPGQPADAPVDTTKTRAADKAYAPEEWDPDNQSCVSVFGVGQCEGEPMACRLSSACINVFAVRTCCFNKEKECAWDGNGSFLSQGQ
jgi:hypothetical protein